MSQVRVAIRVMDHTYQVMCDAAEQDALRASAAFLDARMREIKQTGKVIGAERIAIMAALNLAHELLAAEQARERVAALEKRLAALNDKVESFLRAQTDPEGSKSPSQK